MEVLASPHKLQRNNEKKQFKPTSTQKELVVTKHELVPRRASKRDSQNQKSNTNSRNDTTNRTTCNSSSTNSLTVRSSQKSSTITSTYATSVADMMRTSTPSRS